MSNLGMSSKSLPISKGEPYKHTVKKANNHVSIRDSYESTSMHPVLPLLVPQKEQKIKDGTINGTCK